MYQRNIFKFDRDIIMKNINQNSIAAFIPARGGSKGVPEKNIRAFSGKPLIVHSIEYAKSCEYINEIFVSTNDKAIAKISESSGTKIIHRPAELATDTATTESAIQHFLETVEDKPDIIVLLQATSPLRPKNSLNEALDIFINGKFDSLLSLTPTHQFFWKTNGETAKAEYDFVNRPRRQDFAPNEIPYDENGSLYIFTQKHFEKTGSRLGGKIGYITFSERYGHQIDTLDDFTFLESLAHKN